MSLFYTLAYAVGFTPWERAAEFDKTTLPRMFDDIEQSRGGPGKLLDLGCGSAIHTVELAQRGWDVTGVDLVAKALDRARRRIAEAGVSATVKQQSVTTLSPDNVGTGYDAFLDIGCFHGLNDAERKDMGRGVSAVAADGAALVLFAFEPGRMPPPLPHGATRKDIANAFTGWDVVAEEAINTDGMPLPVRKAQPHWYRLQKT